MTRRYSTGHTTPEDIKHEKEVRKAYWKRYYEKIKRRKLSPAR